MADEDLLQRLGAAFMNRLMPPDQHALSNEWLQVGVTVYMCVSLLADIMRMGCWVQGHDAHILDIRLKRFFNSLGACVKADQKNLHELYEGLVVAVDTAAAVPRKGL
jgi:hypothetical protein